MTAHSAQIASANDHAASGLLKTAVALAAAICAFASQAATSEAWAPTTTKAHDPRGATHVAALRSGDQVDIVVSLQTRNSTQLQALTTKLMSGMAGVSPLTPAQFLDQYAPTAEQAQAVATYLRSQGFANIEIAPNRLLVSATGGAGAIKSAFQAELHQYDVAGRSAYANVTDAKVPSHLASTVLGVVGLQTVHLAHVNAQRLPSDAAVAAQTQATSSVSAISPVNFPAIYGASTLASASNATIGVITQGSVTQTIADLKTFAASAGYPVPSVTTTVVGTASSDASGLDEWNMDTQASLAAAGGTVKSMVLYDVNSLSEANLTLGYNKAVTDNLAKVINVSLGGCESDMGGVRATQDAIFRAAVAQGQTFSVSSGDSGAYECGATAGKAQSYPAVSPYVMAIGGTTLTTTGGTTWTGETVWACTSAATCQQSSAGGAGGGASLTETAPSWQTAAGVLGTSTMRGVPDVSFDASPYSGALVVVKGAKVQIGGTSLAAPLFTGFWARIQSANGNALPFPASTLYAGAATHATWFHDVTAGSQGYSAATGWDYASGYGSLQVANFATAFTTASSTGPTAKFTSSTSGLTAAFTDASTDTGGTVGSYAWNFGDGSTSATKNPTHTYPGAGTYTVSETVKDSSGKSGTASNSVTVSTAATQLLSNPGFENSTASPWTVTSGLLCSNASCSGETAHAGANFLWFDGYGTTHTDMASQSVAIPAGKSSAVLSLYLHIDTKETGTTVVDTFKVQVLNASGTVLSTLATYSNANAASGYILRTLSMTPYIGQTVTIRFTGMENGSKATSFVLDDVALTVQ